MSGCSGKPKVVSELSVQKSLPPSTKPGFRQTVRVQSLAAGQPDNQSGLLVRLQSQHQRQPQRQRLRQRHVSATLVQCITPAGITVGNELHGLACGRYVAALHMPNRCHLQAPQLLCVTASAHSNSNSYSYSFNDSHNNRDSDRPQHTWSVVNEDCRELSAMLADLYDFRCMCVSQM